MPPQETSELRNRIAFAIARYDWDHGVSTDPDVGLHHGGAAEAVMKVVDSEIAAACRDERDRIAEAIVDDEQRCQAVIDAHPTNPWMCGRLVGLQRARDIAADSYGHTWRMREKEAATELSRHDQEHGIYWEDQ